MTQGISHWERRTKTFVTQIDESNLRLQRAWQLCYEHFFLLRSCLRSFQLIFRRNLHDYVALFIAILYHPLSKTNPESWVFSRACWHRPLDVFALISDWLTWLPSRFDDWPKLIPRVLFYDNMITINLLMAYFLSCTSFFTMKSRYVRLPIKDTLPPPFFDC